MATIRNWVSVVLMMGASAAAAAPQMTIMASGDCRDTELVAGHRAFVDEMHRRMPGFEVPLIAERLGHPASRSAEELNRQLDAIRQQFYQGQYPLALQRLQDVLAEIRRLRPGRDQWSLWVSAQLLNGLVLHRLSRAEDGDEAFRQVLRVYPKYELSADYYAPSTRESFEQLRRKLTTTKKVTLSVTSTPTKADVYVDGFLVGQTPFAHSFPSGVYQVALSLEEKRSFPRRLELQRETHQHVDLTFEGAVQVHPTLCIDDGGSEAATFGTAVTLAALLGTPQLAVLRLVRQGNGTSWLVATLLSTETGERIREGGIQATRDGIPSTALGELTHFVAAGEPGPNVQEAPLLYTREPKPVGSAPVSNAGKVPPMGKGARPKTSPGVSALGRTWKTPMGVGLLTAGILSAGAGIPLQFQASNARREFEVYYGGGMSPRPEQAAEVRELRDRAYAQQNQAIAAFVGGGAAVIGGVLLLMIDGAAGADSESPRISLQLTPQSTVVGFAGNW